MRDPKLVIFGILVLLAGLGCGGKAYLATQARNQFDAQHVTPPYPAPLPSDEESRDALVKYLELANAASTWWIIANVLMGAGVLLTLLGLLGKSRKPPIEHKG